MTSLLTRILIFKQRNTPEILRVLVHFPFIFYFANVPRENGVETVPLVLKLTDVMCLVQPLKCHQCIGEKPVQHMESLPHSQEDCHLPQRLRMNSALRSAVYNFGLTQLFICSTHQSGAGTSFWRNPFFASSLYVLIPYSPKCTKFLIFFFFCFCFLFYLFCQQQQYIYIFRGAVYLSAEN